MRRYQFCRLHIVTGERSVGEMDAADLRDALTYLNRYNAQMPGTWQYWMEPAQMNGRIV